MKELLLLFACASLAAASYREHLNQFLHEFEELAKEKVYLEHVTNFTVLTGMKIYVRIELQSKVFHASLQPHTSLFHPDLVIKHKFKDGDKLGSINIEEYLEGSLVDEPSSRVLVHIKDNIITGSVQVSDREKYFFEPSDKHIKEPHDFHMIAYKLSDVKFNLTKPEDGGHFCGHESHAGQTEFSDKDFEFMIPKTPVNGQDGFEYSRKKRNADRKTRCPLALIADYKFYQLHKEDEASTINYMIGLIQQIDPLYKRQIMDPSDDEDFSDYGFSVKYIEVVMDTSEQDSSSYKFDGVKRGVSDLLKNFAYGPWRPDYCLAHLFTNYDFAGGVLGLAYVASPSQSRVGGICTKTYYVSGQKKSLNVGLTTATNYGRTLLSSELVFVTGHEFGHNWGSSHDSDTSTDCAPSGNRYMMYPAAVDGSQSNNYYFSPCSKRAINDVLRSKADVCFTKPNASICGNGVVEDGEECDPGMEETSCCTKCRLTRGSECEPLNQECCGEKGTPQHCKFHLNKVCLDTNWKEDKHNIHCFENFTCRINSTSTEWECMAGEKAIDGDVCFDNGRCNDGICQGMCEYNNLEPCRCSPPVPDPDFPDKELPSNVCKQCCKNSDTGLCEPFKINSTSLVENLSNGKVCGDGNGNCDEGVCKIGAQDVQEKFWEVMDRLDVNMLARWFKNNIVFAIIIFTSIFWIPISFFVDWLDNKYDLGVFDEYLGSSDKEKKIDEKKREIQESSAV